ncbi:MAG: 2Fe-2S iron-sulfur cluster binding domain-containing protein [Nanoarchaeota archaeon]
MAKIIFSDNGKEINVEDKDFIKDACEKLGVPFSCTEGICGTCIIDVADGQENLSELTQEEKDMGMNRTRRLACQCKIKSGIVKIKY